MPAGDLLTGNWQVEIQGLLTGSTTDYGIVEDPGIGGLGQVPVKSQDYERAGAEGSVAHEEFLGARDITVPYEILMGDAATAYNRLTTLTTAWDPVTADVELHWQLPGWGHCKVTGRPLGFAGEDFSQAFYGVIRVLALFRAHDPTITKGIV